MKFVVTGATGFVGRWLIKGIKADGHTGTAIVRKGQKDCLISDPLFDGINIIELEMDGYGRIWEYGAGADCLINLSWEGSRGADRMDGALQKTNYLCTLEAIKSMVRTECKCIVTAGSQAEYGNIQGKITEETIPVPNTEYGRYKLQLFDEAAEFCGKNNIKLIEPRYFSLYGPGDTDKTMIVNMLKRMLRDEDCDLTESVQMWDFLYIEDAIEALLRLVTSDAAGGVYNFASGDCRMLRTFIEEMKEVVGSKSILNYGKISYPCTGMVSIEPDITKLATTIGWKAKTEFKNGIMAVIDSL